MRESYVQGKLKSACAADPVGIFFAKLTTPGRRGAADCLLIAKRRGRWPRARFALVECKRPGEEPRPLQLHWLEKLAGYGATVAVIDHPEQIGPFLRDWLGAKGA